MFVMGSNGKKMEEQEQWSDGQGRRRNGRDARSRRRTQNQGRGEAGMSMGSLVLGVIGRNLLVERGGKQLQLRRWQRQRQGRRHKDKKLADLTNVRRKEKREDWDDA
jgi:hypothetical protein